MFLLSFSNIDGGSRRYRDQSTSVLHFSSIAVESALVGQLLAAKDTARADMLNPTCSGRIDVQRRGRPLTVESQPCKERPLDRLRHSIECYMGSRCFKPRALEPPRLGIRQAEAHLTAPSFTITTDIIVPGPKTAHRCLIPNCSSKTPSLTSRERVRRGAVPDDRDIEGFTKAVLPRITPG